jgi:hypothetical protein
MPWYMREPGHRGRIGLFGASVVAFGTFGWVVSGSAVRGLLAAALLPVLLGTLWLTHRLSRSRRWSRRWSVVEWTLAMALFVPLTGVVTDRDSLREALLGMGIGLPVYFLGALVLFRREYKHAS